MPPPQRRSSLIAALREMRLNRDADLAELTSEDVSDEEALRPSGSISSLSSPTRSTESDSLCTTESFGRIPTLPRIGRPHARRPPPLLAVPRIPIDIVTEDGLVRTDSPAFLMPCPPSDVCLGRKFSRPKQSAVRPTRNSPRDSIDDASSPCGCADLVALPQPPQGPPPCSQRRRSSGKSVDLPPIPGSQRESFVLGMQHSSPETTETVISFFVPYLV